MCHTQSAFYKYINARGVTSFVDKGITNQFHGRAFVTHYGKFSVMISCLPLTCMTCQMKELIWPWYLCLRGCLTDRALQLTRQLSNCHYIPMSVAFRDVFNFYTWKFVPRKLQAQDRGLSVFTYWWFVSRNVVALGVYIVHLWDPFTYLACTRST